FALVLDRPHVPAAAVVRGPRPAVLLLAGGALRPRPHRLDRLLARERALPRVVEGAGELDEVDGRGDPAAVRLEALEARGAVGQRQGLAALRRIEAAILAALGVVVVDLAPGAVLRQRPAQTWPMHLQRVEDLRLDVLLVLLPGDRLDHAAQDEVAEVGV